MFNCAAGRQEHCKQISVVCVGSAHSVRATLGLFLLMACVLSWSTLLRLQVALQELRGCSKAGPELRALPRSRLLRFRFSGTPQRHRRGWACILCPPQVLASQATRCLASALSPGVWCVLSPPLARPLGFLGVQWEHHLRCAVCLLWGADLWLRPSWCMSTVQDPRKTSLAIGSLLAVW